MSTCRISGCCKLHPPAGKDLQSINNIRLATRQKLAVTKYPPTSRLTCALNAPPAVKLQGLAYLMRLPHSAAIVGSKYKELVHRGKARCA